MCVCVCVCVCVGSTLTLSRVRSCAPCLGFSARSACEGGVFIYQQIES